MIQAFLVANGKVLQRMQVPTAGTLAAFPLEPGQQVIPFPGPGNIENFDIAADGSIIPRVVNPAEQLTSAKVAKLARINERRNHLWNGICQTAKGAINCDPNSRINLFGAVVAINASSQSPASRRWTMADNSEIVVSIPELRAMAVSVDQFVDNVQQTAKALKDAVIAATTLAEVEAINVEGATWPQ